MIEKFNNIFYLLIFLIHFFGVGFYSYQLIIDTKGFIKRFGIDKTSALPLRMLGGFTFAWLLMALYILFVRPNGVEGTWAFFNILFITHVTVFFTNFYSYKISKLGVTKKTTNETILSPLFFAVLSAILCFGLSNKIYIY